MKLEVLEVTAALAEGGKEAAPRLDAKASPVQPRVSAALGTSEAEGDAKAEAEVEVETSGLAEGSAVGPAAEGFAPAGKGGAGLRSR